MRRVKLSSVNLLQGMYVAQLDRPWLGTPFKPNGFTIESEEQLLELRKYCKHVYIDPERSLLQNEGVQRRISAELASPVKHQAFAHWENPSHAKQASIHSRLIGWLRQPVLLPATASRYEQQFALQYAAASAAYTHAKNELAALHSTIIEQRLLPVPRIQSLAHNFVAEIIANPAAMCWLAAKPGQENYPQKHAVATAVWATLLGQQMRFSQEGLEDLAVGAMLLDVGKLFIPEQILAKVDRLNNYEQEFVVQHVDFAMDIVESSTGLGKDVEDMIAMHHERFDGSGYPDGLSGDSISLVGQIAAISDTYDALISQREYRAAVAPDTAISRLQMFVNKEFSAMVVGNFVAALGVFPIGSLVELNTGAVGLVIEQNPKHRLRPRIRLLLDSEKKLLNKQKMLDLAKIPSDPSQAKARWIKNGIDLESLTIDPFATSQLVAAEEFVT